MKNNSPNLRILTIDDNPSIHEDYRKVLGGCEQETKMLGELDLAAAAFFGGDEEEAVEEEAVEEEAVEEEAVEEEAVEEEATKKTTPSRNVFDIDSALQGQDGLKLVEDSIQNNSPYSVAFIDVRMPPGWNGVETARRIWEVDPDLPVVLCTAYTDYTWDEIVEELDSRSEQLLIQKKPFDNLELRQLAHAQSERRRLAALASLKQEELESLVEKRTTEMKDTQGLVFYSLAILAESRDKCTGEHLERIQVYTALLGDWLCENGPYQEQIDRELAKRISVSSLLHDIGKVGIPDQILLKPGRLTPYEFETMKQHVSVGADALNQAMGLSSSCGFLELAAEITRYHHERFDGAGYPEGLQGQNIPLSARIVALADVFDALTSERPYKSAMSPEDAREIILAESGRHFDPAVIDAFSACWPEFQKQALKGDSGKSIEQPKLV